MVIDVEPNNCFQSYEFYDPLDSPYFIILIPLVVKLQFFYSTKQKKNPMLRRNHLNQIRPNKNHFTDILM